MRESFGALREREFRLLFTGQLISLLGDAFTSVALAFAVLSIGNATDLGIVFAARSVPLVTFLLVGGVFADRLPRRAVMLTADVARLGTQGATAALVLTHNAQVWQLALLQALAGTATAFSQPRIDRTDADDGERRTAAAGERAARAIDVRRRAVGLGIGGTIVAVAGPGWRVSAYDWFGSLAFQPVGLAIAGPLAAGLGTSTTLWIAAAGSVVIAAILVATPSVRALTA